MKLILAYIALLVTVLGLSGCGATRTPNIAPEQLKSCLETSYSDSRGLMLGIDRIAWKNEMPSFNVNNLSESQKRMVEQQFASTPEDSFLALEAYIRNSSNRPLAWNRPWRRPRPPLFQLVDINGVTYNSVGNTTGIYDTLSSKVLLGDQNINPNRELRGTIVFDVPQTGIYVLIVYKARQFGDDYYRGFEIMRCNVPK